MQYKSSKMSLVFQITKFEVVAVNSPHYDENIRHSE